MILFDNAMLQEYSKNDTILQLLNSTLNDEDVIFTSHKWLLESLPKRMIYSYIYGDVLQKNESSKKILDIGGGYSSLTKILVNSNEYELIDIMAHDNKDDLLEIEKKTGKKFWIWDDWYTFTIDQTFDIVIANDIFPNVDQRLEMFIKKFLPVSKEVRIALTYYNTNRFYNVKRLDGDEIFCFLAWNGEITKLVLNKFSKFIDQPNLDLLMYTSVSLFPNNRQICYLKLINQTV